MIKQEQNILSFATRKLNVYEQFDLNVNLMFNELSWGLHIMVFCLKHSLHMEILMHV